MPLWNEQKTNGFVPQLWKEQIKFIVFKPKQEKNWINSFLNYGNNEKKSNVFALKIWSKHKEKLMYSLLKYQWFDIASAYNNINKNKKDKKTSFKIQF